MAINSIVLEVIVKAAALTGRPARILCLGYPDMLVTESQLAAICGPAAAQVTYRDDSEAILRWHGLKEGITRVAETRSVFATLGLEADFVDIVASRGFEKLVDLNDPAPPDLTGRYDLVYDGGTMEHCFNVGQVMRNVLGFARVGGFIIHLNPINYYNHGFFNFNPTFYHDWYAQSGNTIATPYFAMYGPVLDSKIMALDAVARARDVPPDSVLLVAARKDRPEIPPWPMQTKYRKNAELKR